MRPIPHLDLKEHLRLLHKQVLPLFFLILSLGLVAFVVYRTGEAGAELPDGDYAGAPVGLQRPSADAAFDPKFATLSPIELVLAPEAPVFEPFRPRPGGEARAVADGRVALAGDGEVQLIHERAGRVVASVYSGLSSMRVGVGTQVRRGEAVGTAGENFGFEMRRFPALATGRTPGAVGEVPEEWLSPRADRLPPPPGGGPPEPRALRLEEAEPPF